MNFHLKGENAGNFLQYGSSTRMGSGLVFSSQYFRRCSFIVRLVDLYITLSQLSHSERNGYFDVIHKNICNKST